VPPQIRAVRTDLKGLAPVGQCLFRLSQVCGRDTQSEMELNMLGIERQALGPHLHTPGDITMLVEDISQENPGAHIPRKGCPDVMGQPEFFFLDLGQGLSRPVQVP